ncbi:hypothetical protein SNEBB_011249 [Seison nebaliae]|nr:hypothetical protein SNEBB_011249 [Seison nebaliae]
MLRIILFSLSDERRSRILRKRQVRPQRSKTEIFSNLKSWVDKDSLSTTIRPTSSSASSTSSWNVESISMKNYYGLISNQEKIYDIPFKPQRIKRRPTVGFATATIGDVHRLSSGVELIDTDLSSQSTNSLLWTNGLSTTSNELKTIKFN